MAEAISSRLEWSERGDPGGFCVIAGTTASGKSALALALAERLDGVIINADSVQLYKSLPLLTAQPSGADRKAAPHRLYGILDDEDQASVASWLDLALATIHNIQPKTAIIVGGTAFYLEALLLGLPPVPATHPEVRAKAQALLDAEGLTALRRRLAERDPDLAVHGLPRDPQRVLRAYEVIEATGKSILTWQQRPRQPAPMPRFRGGIALVPERKRLLRRIEQRTRAMVAAGVVDEVAAWLTRPSAGRSPLRKADGVAAFEAHLAGDLTLEEAIEATNIKVRRYAKRQRTWLRNRALGLPTFAGTGDEALASLGQG